MTVGDRFSAVVPEHSEDIAVLEDGHWRYLQVKTKSAGLHQWSLTDVLSPDGGIKSLYRSFHALADSAASMELILEGGLKSRDNIPALLR